MAVFEQLPAVLDLAVVAGDEFTFTAGFNVDLTGYTVTGSVFNPATGSSVATPTLTVTPGTTSTVTLTLTETQTQAVYAASSPTNGSPTVRMRWFLRWVTPAGYTRTVLSGLARIGGP